MTEQGAADSLFQLAFESQTQLRILAAHFARALLRHSTLKSKRHREGRVPAGTRSPLREKHTQKNRTAAPSSSSWSPCCAHANCSVRIGMSCSTSTANIALGRASQAGQEAAGDPAAAVGSGSRDAQGCEESRSDRSVLLPITWPKCISKRQIKVVSPAVTIAAIRSRLWSVLLHHGRCGDWRLLWIGIGFSPSDRPAIRRQHTHRANISSPGC
jgi:hypothetical protein